MPVPEYSLFSLELVIDKLYIPHVVCRFPAVAFRLLDFPTILINHVEPELGTKIKEKISRDPRYVTPEQFSELQDNHGNYMIKKGKSCLFKTSIDSLKAHLANTPLYVMALDMFPETPKLVGNSSVPLDGLMKHICADIAKKGLTVPSVHGDKGLFKIYSLMGEEIGYIVLGFRLLCLGPSFLGHIPKKNILQSPKLTTEDDDNEQNAVKVINVAPIMSEKTQMESVILQKETHQPRSEVRTSQDMGSMTDAMKHDVLLQTIPTNDKAIHVVISEPVPSKPKHSSTSTQTHTKSRRKKQHVLLQGLDLKPESEDEDFLETPNIVCPPPLFFNRYSEPKLRTERPIDYTDDESVDDISEIGSVCGKKEPPDSTIPKNKKNMSSSCSPGRSAPLPCSISVHESRLKNKQKSVQISTPQIKTDAVFPILTALLNELVGIQGAHGLENVIKCIGDATKRQQSPRETKKSRPVDAIQLSVTRPTLSSETKRIERKPVEDQSPGNKGWLRKVPESVPKTGKLTYRLTKTQKLRIAKSNPKWLQEKEKNDDILKPNQPQHVIEENEDNLNVTNFSDTLTEVRRLAEKELANETLDSIQDIDISPRSSPKYDKKSHKKAKQKHHQTKSSKRSPKLKQKQISPTSKLNPRPVFSTKEVQSTSSKKLTESARSVKQVKSSPSVMEHDDTHPAPVAMEPDLRRFVSPSHTSTGSEVTNGDEVEDKVSQRFQKGIEVHLPEAAADDVSDDDISLPDNDKAGTKMSSGLVERTDSFRDSILGKSQNSFEMSHTADDHGPLESTRTSQNYLNEVLDSKVYHSITDNESRQFLSTEEPELKQLLSDEDSSVVSPRYIPTFADASNKPSVRSSLKFPVLNPVASENSPIPTTRKSTVKYEGQGHHSSRLSDNVSSAGSSMVPTPRGRRPVPKVRDSIHTESVSSYQPTEADGAMSFNNYSDDFQFSGSIGSVSSLSQSPEVPRNRLIPSTKLGYTIS